MAAAAVKALRSKKLRSNSWTASSSSTPTPAAASSGPPPTLSAAPIFASGLLSTILLPICYFASKDGYWHREDDDGGGSRPNSSAPSTSRRLFDCYRNSLCSIQCSHVPGWAYKSRLPYIELQDSDLLQFASLRVQRQFYHEAGIKTAVFLGCTSGEIEFGITTSSINGNLHMNAHQVFSEDFVQQSLQLGDQELIHGPAPLDQSRPSSSSSSLRSLSASSPEYSSVVMTMASPPEAAALPHQVTMQTYGRGGVHRSAAAGPFPSPASDDAAMARAMLAVISSKNSSSSISQTAPAAAAEGGAYRSYSAADAGRQPVGAFVPYSRAHEARADAAAAAVPILHGQKMIKMAINQVRVINLMKQNEATAAAAAAAQEVRPTTNQLHHMISERKRREKINESFDALRILLPPGSKKDKASVLANTRKYVNTLKAQILELEERNRVLLGATTTTHQISDQIGEIGSNDRPIQVQIESTSDQTQGRNLTLTVRSAEGDMIDLVLSVLQCLKKMGDEASVDLLSVEARTRSPPSNGRIEARFTLRVTKGGDWDEDSFREGLRKAIDAAVDRSGPSN